MPPKAVPTQRQKRLGSELRRMRVSAGMSAEQAANLLGVDRGKISYMESGVRTISEERLRTLAHHCGCQNAKYVDALVEMAQTSGQGWWEQYRGVLPQGLLDIAELEARTTRMRTACTAHIPGLLQTAEYALAVFRAVIPRLHEHEVATRLAHRTHRQRVLNGETPTPFIGIVHEAALRMQFGGRQVARAQLEHLLEESEKDNVTVLAIPFSQGAFPGAGQTVLYAEGVTAELDTVQIDNSHGPDFLHGTGELAKYRAHLDRMVDLALPEDDSRSFIHAIAQDL
ncbi:helix-turn-helix domain-containing protein [Streptomyces lomondensis]|uniref:Transcriptional regulator n=1 Tax=Streptomyces lomondensis TaxID=68229 RepID=A0ABQ2WW84_9ACTN|nr:helix-turn-helix transcriptional regulator [Streptomyces lomondensis]MCF0078513.1 helix-turn-helix transcriptional regulator [Streptomyces lomondensis]GGW78016.1 transcriptional regulator [Streptomyces lomondensis]